MRRPGTGGGWAAVWYTLRMANRVGWWRLWQAMRRKNACKTCALGMGGQAGGMRNEAGHWPEVCKKSFQAMVADMQKGLSPEFFAKYSIAQLQTLSSRELESCGRLVAPIYAGPGDTHYRVLAWDDALGRVTEQLRRTPSDQAFFYASGRSSNEAGFLYQLLGRLYGTNYVNNCSFYCHQASGVGLGLSVGSGTATISLDDVEKCDLFILIGGNPASNHPRMMRTLMSIRRRGGHVLVVNPVREVGLVNFSVPSDVWSMLFGSKIASLYVQPHIGGDMAFLLGVAKVVLERGGEDKDYLASATEGYAAYKAKVEATSWDDITSASGVDRATITQAAELVLKSKGTVFGWTMGITHHEHGVENVRAIVNLALLRGMVGRPNAGLLPIRGHSNVQGMGSMGVTPSLKKDVLEKLETLLGVTLPRSPGLDTMACMRAAHEGTMRTAICLGGNLFGSNPNAKFAHEAIGKLDFVAYLSTTLNTGHAWGLGRETLILPVKARDEEPQPTTQESMFNFVRLSDGGPERLPGTRSEVEVITAIGERLLGNAPVAWKELSRLCHLRQIIAKVVPGYEALETIDATKKEFNVGGRVKHTPTFATPSGKASFAVEEMPRRNLQPNELMLMTIRSEGQFNTVVYEEEDLYRGQDRRDIILMHNDDIQRLGLKVDQRVVVRSVVGEMRVLVREFDVRAGNAVMYFPEANVLVPGGVDPRSHTPAFKAVKITVEPEPLTRPGDDGRVGLAVVPS